MIATHQKYVDPLTWFYRLTPLLILVVWFVMALAGSWLPLHPNEIDLAKILLPPDVKYLMGFDDLGRPIFDRLRSLPGRRRGHATRSAICRRLS